MHEHESGQQARDVILLHGYTDKEGYLGNFGYRNKMQASAALSLYASGRAKAIFLAGGNYWGEGNPSFSDVMKDRLIDRGVNPNHIVVRPETTTTTGEIETFFDEAQNQGWERERLASLSTKTHTHRVRLGYKRKSASDVGQFEAENVLYEVKSGEKYPYRDFLANFRRSELPFRLREAVAYTFEFVGLGGLGKMFSDSRVGQFIKSKLDG